MKNPIDSFIATFENTDIRTRGYACRQFYSTINASVIGLANRVIAKMEQDMTTGNMRGHAANRDEHTVDDFNKLIAGLAAEESAPVGLEPTTPPEVLARWFIVTRDHVLDSLNISDTMRQSFGDYRSTLSFMATPRTVNEARLKELAAFTKVDAGVLRAGLEEANRRDADTLVRRSDEIVDYIREEVDGFDNLELLDFDNAPPSVRVRIADIVKRVFEKQQQQFAISFARFGRGMTELGLIAGALNELNEWSQHQEQNDPEFAAALLRTAA